jgi:alpha(1,3/1,4) fucosyltransferase
MIKATFFTQKFFMGNRQFSMTDEANRDDCLYGFFLLKEMLEKENIDLSTQDINHPTEARFIIYNEMPKVQYNYKNKNSYLLLFESELIRPDNWDIGKHASFSKIFTWNDEFVDNHKYFKMNFPNRINLLPDNFSIERKKKLCTMIAGHKYKPHPLELYSERLKTIRWFEKNHPADFDLYGIGWSGNPGRKSHLLNYLKSLMGINEPVFPSYRGMIHSKIDVLPNYRFAICYENARDITGYITEKIFDCFFSGCVPIYWGEPNVERHIPTNTFIPRSDFENHEALYSYITQMSEEDYESYLLAISDFLKSEKVYPFSAECFADTICREILKDIDSK